MDPSLIATATMAILLPFFKKGGMALAEGIGKDLWEEVKSVFTKKEHGELVEKIEKTPDNPVLHTELKKELQSLLENNQALMNKFSDILAKSKTNQVNQTGSDNVAAVDVNYSSIVINK